MPALIPYRIRVGVTGHRKDLPDEESIKASVCEILSNQVYSLLAKETDKNPPLAFSIISPLAEGADQIVAEAVLDFNTDKSASILEAVLPLKKEEYLETIEDENARKNLQELIGRKACVEVTELRSDVLREKLVGDNLIAAREDAYEACGRYVVNHCDVLIAVIDPSREKKPGGTLSIVEYAIDKNRPVIQILINDSNKIKVVKGSGLNLKSLERVTAFNGVYAAVSEDDAYLHNVISDWFPEKYSFDIETKGLVIKELLPMYVAASRVAKKNQRWFKWAGMMAYVLSAGAVISIALGLCFEPFYNWAFVAEAVFLFIIFTLIITANRMRVHMNWIESRFLAERIRAVSYLLLAGMKKLPVINIKPFTGKSHEMNDWMIRLYNEMIIRIKMQNSETASNQKSIKQYITENWISDQLDYHRNRAAHLRNVSRGIEYSGFAIFALAFAAALLHVIPFAFNLPELSHGFEVTLILLALSLPAVASTLEGFRNQRGYSRNRKLSEEMVPLLEELNDRMAHVIDQNDFHQILTEMDELMMREGEEWMISMGTVKMEVVT